LYDEKEFCVNLTIIGTGYVGLVSAACFAEYGNQVICVDTDKRKIDDLSTGEMPIFEPNLQELVARNRALGTIQFTDDIKYGIEHCEICFICVGTPEGECGATDLRYIVDVANDIGSYMDHYIIVVDKSTVPVGTADIVSEIISGKLNDRKVSHRFHIVSNPEFLKEGDAIKDCMRPDRIIVGVDEPAVGRIMHELYRPFIRKHDNYIEMDILSAEMTKYAANAMLATKISFMNEIANICERTGADVDKVRIGIGSDSRIGYSFIYPGIGYGGSCFPKDVKSLIWIAENKGYKPQLLKSVEDVNNRQKKKIPEKVIERFGENLNGYTFAVWGLSFKPNTDDMRNAPAIEVINTLTSIGATIRAYDPKAMDVARNEYFAGNKNVQFGENKYEILDGADALLLLTEWKEFLSPEFGRVKKQLKNPLIIDGRNQYDKDYLTSIGIELIQIGKGI
jgi:UDPglucose 6-dehydrogenase